MQCFTLVRVLQTVLPRGRNNSKMYANLQDYVVGKSGSPQVYVVQSVVIWPRFKQNLKN